jgi:hypothetical protein
MVRAASQPASRLLHYMFMRGCTLGLRYYVSNTLVDRR